MSVTEVRKAKFHWQAPDEIEHIRYEWRLSSPSGSVGLGVYRALTELATEDKARTNLTSGGDSERYRTSQKEIAERAMVSDRTAAKACEELERIGLLAIETDRDGENRPGRPSFYILLDPPATYERVQHPATSERGSYVEVIQRTKGVQTTSEAVSDVPAKGTNSVRTSLYRGRRKEKKEEGARVVETEESTKAWEAAKELLRRQLPPAKFDQIRELAVAGECAGCLVLVDHSDRGACDWRDRAEPVILETVAGFDAVEILDEHEIEQATPLSEWDVWLAHFHEVTGRTAMTGSKVARQLFEARRRDNDPADPPRSLEELKLATIGAHGDEYLRSNGLDKPETILRESNIGRYIELGRSAGRDPRGGMADPALAAITGRQA
jgi:DNA-binding MarR family transcriptional regulator